MRSPGLEAAASAVQPVEHPSAHRRRLQEMQCPAHQPAFHAWAVLRMVQRPVLQRDSPAERVLPPSSARVHCVLLRPSSSTESVRGSACRQHTEPSPLSAKPDPPHWKRRRPRAWFPACAPALPFGWRAACPPRNRRPRRTLFQRCASRGREPHGAWS